MRARKTAIVDAISRRCARWKSLLSSYPSNKNARPRVRSAFVLSSWQFMAPTFWLGDLLLDIIGGGAFIARSTIRVVLSSNRALSRCGPSRDFSGHLHIVCLLLRPTQLGGRRSTTAQAFGRHLALDHPRCRFVIPSPDSRRATALGFAQAATPLRARSSAILGRRTFIERPDDPGLGVTSSTCHGCDFPAAIVCRRSIVPHDVGGSANDVERVPGHSEWPVLPTVSRLLRDRPP